MMNVCGEVSLITGFLDSVSTISIVQMKLVESVRWEGAPVVETIAMTGIEPMKWITTTYLGPVMDR